jgi:hypothetical protein
VPRQKKTKVFVSYSRHDEALVKPLASLLGVAAQDAVFLDIEQLRAGDLWEKKIVGAIHSCSMFVLCWCCNSEKSEYVAKEIGIALADKNKKLVPVLFCSTALPAEFSTSQWIDLRGRVVHQCTREHEEAKSATHRIVKSVKKFLLLGTLIMGPTIADTGTGGTYDPYRENIDIDASSDPEVTRLARATRAYFEGLTAK